MNLPFTTTYLISLVFITLSFSQCTSTKHAMNISETFQIVASENPKAYFQHWVAGVRGCGSGTDIYIHKNLLEGKIADSIFFQKRVSKLSRPTDQNEFYTAGFRRALNQLEVQELETDGITQHVEEITNTEKEFPFDLKQNEAVISYKDNRKVKYLKLTDIVKKEMPMYPSAPPNRNK